MKIFRHARRAHSPALLAAFFALAALSAACLPVDADSEAVITIDTGSAGVPVSPDLYGIFFEEINRAGDGGIYGEMLQNRSFEDRVDAPLGWTAVAGPGVEAVTALDRSKPLNAQNPTSMMIEVVRTNGGRAGIANQGFKGVPEFPLDKPQEWMAKFEAAARRSDNGLAVRQGHVYRLSFYARGAAGWAAPLTADLESQDGTVLAAQKIGGIGTAWKKFAITLTPRRSDPNARLVISANHVGTFWLDMVSLFPAETYKNRPNGLRPDLVAMLRAMHPAFMRFPGGSFAEGHTLADAYHWKKTIGDPALRPGHWNIWGYRSSDGLGFHEYLQMCEDLQAAPLFVVNCGMAEKDFVPVSELGPWVQDAVDAIEYANGPVTSKWGALRAKNGHPAPFHLKYVEIGNENGLDYPWGGGKPGEYLERYRPFYKAIKARFPNIILIANIKLDAPMQIVDEHYYNSASWFLGQTHRYDHYDRSGPKVYLGEYAVTAGAGGGNLGAALGEAAFMTGLERNADIVVMGSYAPLFVNPSWSRWGPDAVVFDNTRAYGTPSYWVQALFAANRSDLSLPVTVDSPTVTGALARPDDADAKAAVTPSLFVTAGRRLSPNEIIIKAVNVSGRPVSAALRLQGYDRLAPNGQAIVLTSGNILDENSFDSPLKIAPRVTPLTEIAPVFQHTFPANSVTILKLTVR